MVFLILIRVEDPDPLESETINLPGSGSKCPDKSDPDPK